MKSIIVARSTGLGEDYTKGGYQLVWADEFNEEDAPNPKNWVFEKSFIRNQEAQWYQTENALCKNGKLHIVGREDIKRNPGYVKGKYGGTKH